MKIWQISADSFYRVRVSKSPIPNRPEIKDLITDGCGNWAVDWGREWTWGYEKQVGDLEQEFQRQRHSIDPLVPMSFPSLPSVHDPDWDEIKDFFRAHPGDAESEDESGIYLVGGKPTRVGAESYGMYRYSLANGERETSGDDATETGNTKCRIDLAVDFCRHSELSVIEGLICFYVYASWAKTFFTASTARFTLEASSAQSEWDFEDDWFNRIYPRVQHFYRRALQDLSSFALVVGFPDCSRHLSLGFASYAPFITKEVQRINKEIDGD